MLNVAATMKTADGKGDVLEQEFKKFLPKFLSDPGLITYIVHRALDDPNKFFIYEKYENNEALKVHSSTPHFKEFSGAIAPLLAGRPEITLYRDIC